MRRALRRPHCRRAGAGGRCASRKTGRQGYPCGLLAEQITLEARITTTADIFTAIDAERPYHPATPVGRTLDIMRAHLGSAMPRTVLLR